MTHDTRRTRQSRPGGRAAQVVRRILSATIDELGRVGYGAMRVEDVAMLAQVNKTTIYRRWPTKVALVTAAMADRASRKLPIDTGSLREDLIRSLMVPFELDATEQGMLRVVQQERAVPEVDALARGFRASQRAIRMVMVQRGIERGELPAGVDVGLIVDLISAPVQQALLFNESLDNGDVNRIVNLVLAGAVAQLPTHLDMTENRRTRKIAATSRHHGSPTNATTGPRKKLKK